ncbi:MAG: fructose-bisphosphate aldolase [Candidatus Electrothrix sp. MAN1_4]|nr:fructose-bisphosphate aldolase [Candidatus Electrothrix sp. MAN1_4]
MKIKTLRLRRIIRHQSRNTFILALDHGFTLGPIQGLGKIHPLLEQLTQEDCVDAIVVHRGILTHAVHILAEKRYPAVLMHLSGSTMLSPDPLNKRLVSSVKQAVRLGADGVSVHMNVGSSRDVRMYEEIGRVSEACERWGMPLLIMSYPRGKKIDNEYGEEYILHAVRIAAELGADIIKTNYPGSPQAFRRVAESVDVPVVIAGGCKTNGETPFLTTIQGALKAGGRGVAIGRNVFQHDDPLAMCRKIAHIVHGKPENIELDIRHKDSAS